MRRNSYVIQQPNDIPLSLDLLKQHLRIDWDDTDVLLDHYCRIATSMVEQWTCRALCVQTWATEIHGPIDSDCFYLARVPVIQLTTFKYYLTDGTAQDVDSNIYTLDNATGLIQLKADCTWPTDLLRGMRTYELRYTVGYDNEKEVPDDLKYAVMVITAAAYQYRVIPTNAREVHEQFLSPVIQQLLMKWRGANAY